MKDLPKDIILFSTADWDNPSWTNNQHMASRLARSGFRILYIESLGLRKPTASTRDITRIYRRLAKGMGGLRNVQENLWVYSPLVIPFHGSVSVRSLNRKILRAGIQWHARSLGFDHPIFWTYNPLTLDLIGLFEESMVVYHCVDNLAASPGIPSHAIIETEEKLAKRADLVFTTHPNLQKHLSQWNPDHSYYFPNVADFEHFSSASHSSELPDDLKAIPRPRIGFIGAISNYKIDFECISFIAGARKEWHWVLIGQVGEGQPETFVDLLRKPNIHLLGAKSYHELPRYLKGFDVAVLPNRLNAYTSSMFPMKFFEYLSAGRPVVATDLPALHDYRDVCTLTKTPEAFLDALNDVLGGNVPDITLRLKVAKENTWKSRLVKIEKILAQRWEEKNNGA